MTETRWLSHSEQQLWRAYLEATQRLWERLARELEDTDQLPLGEYEVLVRLSEAAGGSLRMSDLAELVAHSRSRLTHAVSRMEARGLVTRRPCSDDGRGVVCGVTPKGLAALTASAPVHVAGVREHLFDQLDEEEAQVVGRVLTKVAEHLRETRPSVRPAVRETLGA